MGPGTPVQSPVATIVAELAAEASAQHGRDTDALTTGERIEAIVVGGRHADMDVPREAVVLQRWAPWPPARSFHAAIVRAAANSARAAADVRPRPTWSPV